MTSQRTTVSRVLQWAAAAALAAGLPLACHPTPASEGAGTETEVEQIHWQVLPIASLSTFPAAVLQVEGQAWNRWQTVNGKSTPVVVAERETKIHVTVEEIEGARIRGRYGLPVQRAGKKGPEAVFRVTADAAGDHRVLLEDRVRSDTPAARPFELEVPKSFTGSGQVNFEVSFTDPETGGQGLWFDPEVALPLRVQPRSRMADADRTPVNILIVTSDTTRQDILGSYRGPAATPALDSLAMDGVRLREMYSVGYGTTPSHSSLFTGTHPRDHGVYDNDTILRSGVTTLAEVLQDAGYETAAFVGARPLARSLGLDQGFLRYDDIFAVDPASGLAAYSHHERRARRSVDRFLDWLDSNPTPFAAWVHFYDPHQPYVPPGGPPKGEATAVTRAFQGTDGEPRYLDLSTGAVPDGVTPEELDRAARRRYAAEIEAMDRQLGRILTALRQRGAYRDTLVIFVSDHGENFLDRSRLLAFKHAGLYHEVTRLGAIVKLPGAETGGQVSDILCANSDLACLVLDVAGLDVPSGWSCRSFRRNLLPAGHGRAFRPFLVMEGASHQEIAIRTPRWLYRQASPSTPTPVLELLGYRAGSMILLFDLRQDPEERRDVSGQPENRAELGRLRALADDFMAHASATSHQTLDSEEHLRGLRALGYVN